MVYTYSVINDTLRSVVNESRLAYLEIPSSTIKVALDSVTVTGDVLTITFRDTLDSSDESILNNIIALHAGAPYREPDSVVLSTTDSTGRSLVTIDKPSGNFDTVITHDFCDNTTWPATNDSLWTLQPSPGSTISVFKAESQFHHDVQISPSALNLDYYAWIPQSPVPVMAQRITFATINDIFALGNEHYNSPSLPEAPTGLSTVVFSYPNKLVLHGDRVDGSLAHVEISTSNNTEITGGYATVGFVVREL